TAHSASALEAPASTAIPAQKSPAAQRRAISALIGPGGQATDQPRTNPVARRAVREADMLPPASWAPGRLSTDRVAAPTAFAPGKDWFALPPPPRCAWSPSPALRAGEDKAAPRLSSPAKRGRGTARRAVEGGAPAARIRGQR